MRHECKMICSKYVLRIFLEPFKAKIFQDWKRFSSVGKNNFHEKMTQEQFIYENELKPTTSKFHKTDVWAYASTTKVQIYTLLSTNDITFDWTAVLRLHSNPDSRNHILSRNISKASIYSSQVIEVHFSVKNSYFFIFIK